MESHVKALSGDVGRLRSKQEDSLDVLKEAIRANYDDNAQRLRESIEQAYDNFLNQIRTIPQALDRYSKFIESLHQNDRLALEALQQETGAILKMQTERFSELSQTTGGMTKIFPLVDKKIEKQGQILEAMRRSQVTQDKQLDGLKAGLQEARQEMLNYTGDVKQSLSEIEERTQQKFREQAQMTATTYEQLEKLQRSDLPAFRQELKNLVTSKFEFMESTQTDRQTAWRDELIRKLDSERKLNRQIYTLLGLGILLTITLQLTMNYESLMGLLR
jgi:methyl-accepting chemotaxis protein